MLINPNQIRAARGLLDWTVAHLAQKVGVGTTTISAIETGRSAGSLEVISSIIYAFQSAGIELTEDGGVRPSQSKISIYKHHEGFCALFDDIYEVAKTSDNPDICITSADENDFEKWLGSYITVHQARMIKLNLQKLRILIKENDMFLNSTAYAEYRWLPKEQFADICTYIYGDKVAFIEFSANDVTVTVVHNKAVTGALRKMYDIAWSGAYKKPKT